MPKLSIVTTVYDRVHYLRNCIDSVKELNFKDYEHIIVSDCPPSGVVQEIESLILKQEGRNIKYFNLDRRYNNYGLTPAIYGAQKSLGEYTAFLSDDNGYLSHHFDALILAMDADPTLSFVYSACKHWKFGILAYPCPERGKIDLGQPLFRQELIKRNCALNALPFKFHYSWDWNFIKYFMSLGNWQFFNDPSFIFKLEAFPQYAPKIS